MVSNRASGGSYSSQYSTLIHITDLLEPAFPGNRGNASNLGILEKTLEKFAFLKNDYKPRECK